MQASTHAEDGRGNEKFLFHGTNRACMLGESASTVLLCCRKTCSLCSILRTSLAVSKCGKLLSYCSSHLDSPLRALQQGTKNAFKRYVIPHDMHVLKHLPLLLTYVGTGTASTSHSVRQVRVVSIPNTPRCLFSLLTIHRGGRIRL